MSRRAPTAAQQRVLDFVVKYRAEHDYSPTIREIAEGVGLASTNGVSQHLRRLEIKGWIRRAPGGAARTILPIDDEPSSTN